MAATTMPVFTPARYAQVAALSYAQILDMQVSSDTTAYITLIDGTAAVVAPCAAVATTTATAAAGDNSIVVASGTNIAVGQIIYAPGSLAPGTTATSVNGTSIGVSSPVTSAMSGTTVKFFAAVTNSSGVAVTCGAPLPLGIGANTHLCYVSQAGGNTSGILNVAIGS